MFASVPAFSGFSADRIEECLDFYRDVLGLDAVAEMGGFRITFANGGQVFVYPKDDHVAATFTVLNFPVDDVDTAVTELNARGVVTKIYDDARMPMDERGIVRGWGPTIAWFRDPAGNVLSVIEANRTT